eukprot:7050132-Pyramimonas_sp.AAC.1
MKFIKVLLVAETKGLDSCPVDRQCDISQVQSLLVESSYNVTVAKSFQEAYVKIRDEQFELFLIDHEPSRGFSACPLLEIISKDERLCRVPSIGTAPFASHLVHDHEPGPMKHASSCTKAFIAKYQMKKKNC